MTRAVDNFGCLGCWRHELVAVDGFRHVETAAPAYVTHCYEMLNTVITVRVLINGNTATDWSSQSHAFFFDKIRLAY